METRATQFNRYQLKKLMQVVSRYDIGSNAAPEAIFDPLIQGFNLWCTPDDHPGGDWLQVVQHMDSGAFTKPCAFVATVFGWWNDDRLVFKFSSDAYLLSDHLSEYKKTGIHNRKCDIVWARRKITWVFAQADLPNPALVVGR